MKQFIDYLWEEIPVNRVTYYLAMTTCWLAVASAVVRLVTYFI